MKFSFFAVILDAKSPPRPLPTAFSPIRSPPNSQLRKKKLAEAEMRLIATYDWCTARQEAATCEVLAACLSSFGVPTSQVGFENSRLCAILR